jgi:N-acetyl-anhydromuramyl-L-alanine amidase AmpD
MTRIRKLRKILVLTAVYLTVQSGPTFATAAQAPQQPAHTRSPAKRPPIVSRKLWNAKHPTGKAAKHTPRFITIHHTGMPQKPELTLEQKMRGLQNFSQNEGKLASGKSKLAWFDVPYHYYIASDGRVAEGRKIKYVGDTNTEYDPAGHALVVLEGSFGKEQPTAKQVESMKKIVAWLARKYNVPAANIKGHGDYAKTGCPGENLKILLPELRVIVH